MVENQIGLSYVIAGGIIIILGCFCFFSFISKRVNQSDSEANLQEKWHQSFFDNNHHGIISIDQELNILSMNEAAVALLGIHEDQFLNQSIESLLSCIEEEKREYTLECFLKASEGKECSYETAIIQQNGEKVLLDITHVPIRAKDYLIGNYIVLRDCTKEKQTTEKYQDLAYRDELTGLLNRRRFYEIFSDKLEANTQQSKQFAIMVVDVDRFKLINDSLGHVYGDQFLREMSDRIRSVTDNHSVTVARVGGDEFVLLLEDFEANELVSQVAEQIIGTLQFPYRLKGKDFYVTASIGIAMFPEHGTDQEQLIKNADTAMYEVKKKGKNAYQFFNSLPRVI